MSACIVPHHHKTGHAALSYQNYCISSGSHHVFLFANEWAVTCVLCLDVLSVSSRAGEGFVTGAALQGGELGRAVVLSCKDIRVVGPVVIP